MLASATGLRVMREIPIDRVLTETDGPFLTRGDKPINPGDVGRAVEMIASSVGSTIEGVRSQIISNLKSLVQSDRSEEHTSELQSLMRISYAVFCLKKKQNRKNL